MKAKLLTLSVIAALSCATLATAKTKVVKTTADGRAMVVTKTGKNWNNHYRSSSWGGWGGSHTSWGIGIGLGSPFYGGYYGGYPGYYGGYYPYGGYPYGYTNYPYGYGYGNGYYANNYQYYNRAAYGYDRSLVARVQARLVRSGYYSGPIDGVIGPRTRYAIRAYESRHGLPPDGRIDGRLLAVMGLA